MAAPGAVDEDERVARAPGVDVEAVAVDARERHGSGGLRGGARCRRAPRPAR